MGWILGTLVVVLLVPWLGRRFLGAPATDDATPSGDVRDSLAPEAIGDTLDLHGVPPREVNALVDAFLAVAHAEGRRHVRIVHGKGIGVLRRSVRARLAGHPHVVRYGDAPLPSGWGATVVELDTAVARPRPTD